MHEIKVERRTIDGVEYEVRQLPALQGMKLFRLLLAHCSPFLSVDVMSSNVGSVVSTFFDKLDEASLMDVLTRIFDSKTVAIVEGSNKPVLTMQRFDAHFAGRLMHLMQVCRFVVEVNYPDFLGVIRRGLSGELDLQAGLQGLTSTGSSGESSPRST